MEKVRQNLNWDYDINNEPHNLNRNPCCTFVVDVWEGEPRLAIYVVKKNGSSTDDPGKQPPREMLVRAVEEQGGNLRSGGLYPVNGEIRRWVEENILLFR